MIDAGLWVPRSQRPRRAHQPRHRRSCLGELVQIDGCDHDWFEDRGPRCTLLVYVDDATSRLQELRFVASESAFDYFASTRPYLLRHGKPVAFYGLFIGFALFAASCRHIAAVDRYLVGPWGVMAMFWTFSWLLGGIGLGRWLSRRPRPTRYRAAGLR